MSASEFLFISNIPNKVGPLTLMTDVNNSLAKMAYFDSPDFKGNRQAFVFYPESDSKKWEKVMQNLNAKESVEARYVYYPTGNDGYVTNVPPGAEVLPYIYVENLPKNIEFHHIVYGLPHIVNLRFMDVTYKEDKWAFIYLGPNVTPAIRRQVVMGLRSKSFSGFPVYASEMMVSKASEFEKKAAVSSLKPSQGVTEEKPSVSKAFRSEFLFLHNVPQPLGHGKILHFIKSSGIQHARIFFVETRDHLKRGFLHMPGLTEEKWNETLELLRSHYFYVPGLPTNCGERITVEETWFQPTGASPPPNDKAGGEFDLTEYYFLYNIPRGVSEQLLVHGIVHNRIRVQMFDPTPPDSGQTRIGFAMKMAAAPDRSAVEEVLNLIRRKRFGDSTIYVDRIWKFSVPPVDEEGTSVVSMPLTSKVSAGDDEDIEMESVESKVEIVTRIKSPNPSLTKSNLIFIHGIPSVVEDSQLFSDLAMIRCAAFATPHQEKRCCFIQPSYLDRHSWSCVLATLYMRIAESSLGAEINELFKEADKRSPQIEGIVRSCFLQVSNLPLDLTEEQLTEGVQHVEDVQFLLPNTMNDRTAVVLLNTSNDDEVGATITSITKKTLRGRVPAVARLWLSSIEKPAIWPSYRAPCQTSEENLEDDNEKPMPEPDGDVSGPNGDVDVQTEMAYSVVVEGLPLLITDFSLTSIFESSGQVRWQDGFCVVTSPSGQNNRLMMYATSNEEAQNLTNSVMPLLKKNFRHRALLTHIRSSVDVDEIVPVSEDAAFRMGSTHLLIYNLPRQGAATVRTKLRELVGSINIDLKCVEKKFLGHGIVTTSDWQTCNTLYDSLRGQKMGTFEIKVKYLAK